MKIITFFKNIISKKNVHNCTFDKPIVSKYVTFSVRDIIYECKCGKRKLKRKCFGEYQHFPIETKIGLTNEQLLDYLK